MKARGACGEKGLMAELRGFTPGFVVFVAKADDERHRRRRQQRPGAGTVRFVVAVAWPPPALPSYLSGERSTCESGLGRLIHPQPSARFVCLTHQPRSTTEVTMVTRPDRFPDRLYKRRSNSNQQTVTQLPITCLSSFLVIVYLFFSRYHHLSSSS